MEHAIELFFWAWVQRLLQPLFAEVQPFKVSAFDWTSEHWAQMAQQSQAPVHASRAAMQTKDAEMQRQAIEKMALAKQRDDAAIGTFEL